MAINKVVYNGNTLIDISDASVTPETLVTGATAYNAAGEKVIGTAGITATDDGAGNVTITMTGVSGINIG